MAKWKIFLISLCAFLAGALILLAALVYIPRTTELDYNMRGFVISTDGQVLEEFNMTATGKEYDFIIDRPGGNATFVGNTPQRVEKDTYYLDIQWDSPTISKNATSCLFNRDFIIPNTQLILGDIDFINIDTDRFESEYALFDSDRGVFYMYADELAESAFILGITDPVADPLEILTLYKSAESLLHRPELLPPAENSCTPIAWDMNGTFVHADGTTKAVNFTVNGNVHDELTNIDTLDITITLPDDFRYLIDKPDPHFVSMNQKHNDLPHLMICQTFAYDKHTNSSVWTYFAINFPQKCMVIEFENSPNCYLVASADTTVNCSQLLEYFADFIDSYGSNH